MTFWQPDIGSRSGPRYRAIAEALIEDVQSGRLPVGSRLPSQRRLAYRIGVTVGTVSRAYAEVQRLGVIDGQIGRGSYIRGLSNPGSRLIHGYAEHQEVVDLSLSYPPSDPVETGLLGKTLKALGQDPTLANFLNYPREEGHPVHRRAAANWLEAGGIPAHADRIVISAGVQHGLATTLAALCEPHDVILAEALSYPGIRGLAVMQHLNLRGVEMDEAGLIPQAFDAACRTRKIRALYTIPNLHNPTCITLPESRRREIAAIARRHNVLLIEDDIYGFMVPGMPRRFVEIAPEQTVYLTGTSKNLSPGLRVGFVVAPDWLVPRIAAMVRATMWMPSPPMVEVFRRLVESGDANKLVAAKHAETHARERLASAILGDLPNQSHSFATHVWLPLPGSWTAGQFSAEARRRGVAVLTGEAFALRQDAMMDATRLCLGLPPDRPLLERALRTIVQLLGERPDQQWRHF
jgi:DNA-binding transcriptional MocR family regulator